MANERRLGILWTFLKILASIVLLLWLYATIDWTQFARTVRTIPSQLLATGLLVAFLGQLLCAWRLRVLLHAQSINVRYGFNVRLTFLGLFAGNFLPSTIGGDALKIVLLARRGYGTAVSTLSVAADRILGLAAFALLLPTVLAAPHIVGLQLLGNSAQIAGLAVVAGCLAIAGLVILLLRSTKLRIAASTRIGRFANITSTVTSALRRWTKRPGDLLFAMALSLAATLAGIVSVWIQAQPMGSSISLIDFIAVYALVYFAALVPISLNGVGVQEMAFVYLLPRVGATPEQAMALALIARFFLVAISLPGAAFMLSSSVSQSASRQRQVADQREPN